MSRGAQADDWPARAGLRLFITGLGIGQICSWGSLYYSFPMIAEAMGSDLGWSKPAPPRGWKRAYSLNSVFFVLAILIRVSASFRSCIRNAAKAAESVAAGTTACFSRNSMNFGSLNTLWNWLESLFTISGGVLFGAATPHQPWPRQSLPPTSAKVGTFGSTRDRLAEVTASAFTLPASISPRKLPTPKRVTCTSLAASAWAAGPPPR